MRSFVIALFCVTLAGVSSLSAQNNVADEAHHHFDVPHLIIDGLIAYHDKGPDEAVRTWIKDSPIDGSKDALNQANNLRQVQSHYGVFRSFEVIGLQDLSQRVRTVYVVLNYDKGPLFGRFMLYRSVDQDWLLTSFNFNTDPQAILPTSMLSLPTVQ
jgi:hypothetical protein